MISNYSCNHNTILVHIHYPTMSEDKIMYSYIADHLSLLFPSYIYYNEMEE